ncbi:hypothetical protein [Methanospirillum stamsii]|nr:hypothetical protein [Methanospirillum stamsii]
MAINLLSKASNQKGRDFSKNTKHDCIVILKRLLIWMKKNTSEMHFLT